MPLWQSLATSFMKRDFGTTRQLTTETEIGILFCDTICPRALGICLKWQVADLFPPDWTFSKVSGLHAYEPRNPGKLYESDILDRVLEQASRKKVSKRVGEVKLYKCLPTGESRESIIASWSPPRGTFEEFVEEQRRSLVLKKKDFCATRE